MPASPAPRPHRDDAIATGIVGLDEILGGGLTPNRMYLVEGAPGSGKTTLALQFLLEGARRGETGLYITLSETEIELRDVAASHGWSLDGLHIFELVNQEGLDPDAEQSILYPSEVELGETTRGVMAMVEKIAPVRVIFDSLSEMRLLAQNPLRHRRQVLALKHFFTRYACTVLLLDDQTSEAGDLQLHSIAHGVINLDQTVQDYGSQRRRLRVIKMRGIAFRGGYHDFNLDTGGITVFQRLIAAEHKGASRSAPATTGNASFDLMLGGGLTHGTNALLLGPSGVGKTTTAIRCMLAALERGEHAAYYLFDESLATLATRSSALGMPIEPHIRSGALQLSQIDPAEMSSGEFISSVRKTVDEDKVSFVVIDSLNAYLKAMPGEKYLVLLMHELLSYLNRRNVITLLILGQHGFVGDMRTDVDLSYLSDTIVVLRFFEAHGEIRSAIAVLKSRTAPHERTIREFRLSHDGLDVGPALADFEGVLSGLPTYRGSQPLLGDEPEAN